MSFVTNQLFLNRSVAMRLDSQYAAQQANQGLMNTMANSQPLGPGKLKSQDLLKQDKFLNFTGLTNWFAAKYLTKWQEKLEKQQKEDIKRSFSTFA